MVVILLLTVFFYGHSPEVAAVIVGSPDECVSQAPQLAAKIQARSEVQGVQWACLIAKPSDKT